MKNWPKDMSAQMPRKKKRQRSNKKRNKNQSSGNRLKTQDILVENTMRKERKVWSCKSMAIESKLQRLLKMGNKALRYVLSKIMKRALNSALMRRNGWRVKDIRLQITNSSIHLLVTICNRRKNRQRLGQELRTKEKMFFLLLKWLMMPSRIAAEIIPQPKVIEVLWVTTKTMIT